MILLGRAKGERRMSDWSENKKNYISKGYGAPGVSQSVKNASVIYIYMYLYTLNESKEIINQSCNWNRSVKNWIGTFGGSDLF